MVHLTALQPCQIKNRRKSINSCGFLHFPAKSAGFGQKAALFEYSRIKVQDSRKILRF
jgi:hypothetical protein